MSFIGKEIGHYIVKDFIGEGSMGEVFLGEHPEIGRKVAIKILSHELCAKPDMAQRFLAEAQSVNRINHPNIIQVFDYGKLEDNRLYLIMEYLEGTDLEDLLREKKKLSFDEAGNYFRQIVSALESAHEEGIIHRDLKPENIFIASTKVGKQVKVLDFGIAKLFDNPQEKGNIVKTQRGTILGTPLYMSPEQAQGDVDRICAQSDIYSLGCILYRMLSGELPIVGDTIYRTIAMQVYEPPTPISKYLPGFPDPLWKILAKSLEKEPQNRFASVADFYQEYHGALAFLTQSSTNKVKKENSVPTVSRIPSKIEQNAESKSPSLQLAAVEKPKYHSQGNENLKPDYIKEFNRPIKNAVHRKSHNLPFSPRKKSTGTATLLGFILAFLIGSAGGFFYFQRTIKKRVTPIADKRKVLEESAILIEDLSKVSKMKNQEKKLRKKTIFESVALGGGSFIVVFFVWIKLSRKG